MASSSFRKVLKSKLGQQECDVIIPHIFLPPRLRRAKATSNMVLRLDLDAAPQILWENRLLYTHQTLSPAEFRRLIGDIIRKIDVYRQDLRTLLNVVGAMEWDKIPDPRNSFPEEEEQVAILEGEQIVEGSLSELRARLEYCADSLGEEQSE